MFGEYESESPRVPSPWDPFLSSPPSEASSLGTAKHTGIPKLVPEVEEGNVEYKLKLTNISPARFDRLVTQLKWRLLEGGGQAYYELGVADSGALIGLSRSDLEQSLETLEMMAGEIGASVIVVKEIEVPPLMVVLADKLSGYLDPDTGEWANKMLSRRTRVILTSNDNLSPTPGTTTEPDTELSTAESTDYEDGMLASSPCDTPAPSSRASPHPAITAAYSRNLNPSNPSRPTAQSSPFIDPIDDDLALFSMEPEPTFQDCVDDELRLDPSPMIEVDSSGISVDLEIASVYKPRPFRRRMSVQQSTPAHGQGKRGHKLREKKQQPWHTASRVISAAEEDATDAGKLSLSAEHKETKATLRRLARDKRRQEKRQALLGSLTGGDPFVTTDPSISLSDSEETKQLVSGLEEMHVTLQTTPPSNIVSPVNTKVHRVDEDLAVLAHAADKLAQLGPSVDVLLAEAPVTTGIEPRLIVEALVVRKLSLDEAYLDFGRF